MAQTKCRRRDGFTLMELVISLAVMAVLAGAAVPGFVGIVQASRTTDAANELRAFVQLARSEATKRARTVTLCPTTDRTSCSGTDDWTTGWLVIDAGGAIVRVRPGLGAGTGLEPNTSQTAVAFGTVGNASAAAGGPPPDFTVRVGDKVRWVCLELSGKAEVSKVRCP